LFVFRKISNIFIELRLTKRQSLQNYGTKRIISYFLKLNTLDVLLVGGGNVGLEKISAMLQNSPEARITVVAPMILDSLREYIRHFEQVQIIEREFQEQDLDNRTW
jgi:siroheme synthase (precorrin-2 oxidase/ferrochelatase)